VVEHEDPKTLTGVWFIKWTSIEKTQLPRTPIVIGQVVRQLLPDIYLVEYYNFDNKGMKASYPKHMNVVPLVHMVEDFSFYDSKMEADNAYQEFCNRGDK
jgi:hypothetical protein